MAIVEEKKGFGGEPKEITEEFIMTTISGLDYEDAIEELNNLRKIDRATRNFIDKSPKIKKHLQGLRKYSPKYNVEYKYNPKYNEEKTKKLIGTLNFMWLQNTNQFMPNYINFIHILQYIKEGADPNAPSKVLGYSPFHAAIITPYFFTQKLGANLIKSGASINQRSIISGDTPLHIAITKNPQSGIAQYLIAQGAEVNIKNFNGQTPLDVLEIIMKDLQNYPVYNFYHSIMESLNSRGAKHGNEIKD